jgi:hypothetical protein
MLYILAIGVDKYPQLGNTCGIFGDESCNLTFSDADAALSSTQSKSGWARAMTR